MVTYLEDSKECSCRIEASSGIDEALKSGNNRPQANLRRHPTVRPELLRYELRGKLGKEEGDKENCISNVVIFDLG